MPRRRFILISAAATGLALLRTAAAPSPVLQVWRGTALGADATLQLHHPDPQVARRLIRASLDEVARLERQLSLYHPDSALVRLNRDGVLDDPPPDLLCLLAHAARFHALTDGAFDVTVQPLWELYAAHFGRPDADPAGPPAEALRRAVARVGQGRMTLRADRIALAPGMGVTLNGIAQGYVTDRVVELLRRNGLASALVDMGEIRALGPHPAGGPWSIGIEDPAAPGQAAERIPLVDGAIATSGGYGTRFDRAGRFNHIFDPADGSSSWRYGAVSVLAPDATTADALSTAFTLLPRHRLAALARSCGVTAHLAGTDGSRAVLPSPPPGFPA